MNGQNAIIGTLRSFFSKLFAVLGRFVAQWFISWFVFIPFMILVFISPDAWGHNESYIAMHEIFKLFTVTISVFMVLRVADEETPEYFGLKRDTQAIKDFFIGVLITFIALGVNFLMFLSLGIIKVIGYAWETIPFSSVILYLAGMFAIFCFVGWSEELLSRGFHLQMIEKRFGRFWAVFLSSLMFSYMHRDNPDITILSLVFIFFGGLMLAFAYTKTDSLWLSIGLHTGWDFFLVTIFFGVPISNLRLFSLMDIVYTDNSIIYILFVHFMQYVALTLCFIFIVNYAKIRNLKTATNSPT